MVSLHLSSPPCREVVCALGAPYLLHLLSSLVLPPCLFLLISPHPHPSSPASAPGDGSTAPSSLHQLPLPGRLPTCIGDVDCLHGGWVQPQGQVGLGALTKERPSHMNRFPAIPHEKISCSLILRSIFDAQLMEYPVLSLYHVAWSLLALTLLPRAVWRQPLQFAGSSGHPDKVRTLAFRKSWKWNLNLLSGSASVDSVVPQEERPARSAAPPAESRVQAEQDPILYHHDGLQP